jgi:hypothetical protein
MPQCGGRQVRVVCLAGGIQRHAVVCWIWMVRVEGNGTKEGEFYGVGLVR